ncbi:MAG: hypothetical protein OXF88_03720 [Rhodobacteraceae bacterium]|nr:hypothetical protein [Paracoccaceae bacterium]MCY4137024.1 hypothetical protein [Paracoccaceae bacterium]
MTFERLNADGTWSKLTEEEARAETLAECVANHGETRGREMFEMRWSALTTPITPWDELTGSEKYLADKMQSEHEVNAAAARAGLASILDLPPRADDEFVSPDVLV